MSTSRALKVLNLNIDILVAEAKIVLKHKFLHERPVDITMPSEIKEEISKNLNLNPVKLRKYFHKKFDLSNITSKQIHY
ncbi:18141_t:CDS:2 [Racocetra fulgida]|uniref:18141_t:CDS:1 n=1 Tax=Racocetra fulgida TaxID=60492 RepID=A0A9N8VLJ8_9GLOM|nr:18141_t:CDS:2 [Racocetra fulgida]